MITAILEILAKALGIFKNRQEEKNAAPVVAAQKAQNDIDQKNKLEGNVAARDLPAARRDWAE